MLSKYDFISRAGSNIHTNDEGIIDIVLEGMDVDGESLIDIFYTCGSFDEYKIDFGGGVYAITCRDVLMHCEGEKNTLRDSLGLRNTKQNNTLCADIIRICEDEVRNSGYIF